MSFSSSSETLLPPSSPNEYLPTPELSPFSDDGEAPTISLEIPLVTPTDTPTAYREQGEQLRIDLEQFYHENRESIELSLGFEAQARGDKIVDLDVALESFMKSVDVVLEGLVVLGNVHPVLGTAIFAFHGIVKLDIARRDNNKKVLAVVLQMQSMMSAMFELRALNGIRLYKARRNEEKGSLQQLCEQIDRDITSCRSDLAYYSKRRFMSKLIKYKNYEQIFAGHIRTFAQRRLELQMIIANYINDDTDSTKSALIDVGRKLDGMDLKFEARTLEIFRKLDTPRERRVLEFLDRNGGPQKCVDSPDLLRKLFFEGGEVLSTGKGGQDDFVAVQKDLKDELLSDLKLVLEKNQTRFEKLLNVQNNNLKRISEQMEDQGQIMHNHSSKLGEILTKVNTVMVYEEGTFKKKAVKLKDPAIQQVWERMGLDRRSVKAKHFVLTFRDHILTGYSMPSTPHTSRPMDLYTEESSNLLFSTNAISPGGIQSTVHANSAEENRWLLEYIDASYVQPIVEAMDDDGSGFISVQEASKFALGRPKELSLLHWMAYWAAGWHMNLVNYRWNIYHVLLEMHEALPSIHIANRAYVDDYLSDISFRRVETLLRSVRALPENADKEGRLRKITVPIAEAEIHRLNANLKEIAFLLDSAPDVIDIGGEGRVETWILPLLYLVLRRHLAVLKVGQKIVLGEDELPTHSNTLSSIFQVFDERMHSLEGKFRQVHRNVDAQFETFAYGMFFTSFKKKELSPAENTTLSFARTNPFCYTLTIPDPLPEDAPFDTILARPRGKNFEFTEQSICEQETSTTSEHPGHPMGGIWTCFRQLGDEPNYLAPIVFNIGPISNNKVTGTGENFGVSVDLVGTIDPTSNPEGFKIKLRISSNGAFRSVVCDGYYSPDSGIIKGDWEADSHNPNPEIAAADATFNNDAPAISNTSDLKNDHSDDVNTMGIEESAEQAVGKQEEVTDGQNENKKLESKEVESEETEIEETESEELESQDEEVGHVQTEAVEVVTTVEVEDTEGVDEAGTATDTGGEGTSNPTESNPNETTEVTPDVHTVADDADEATSESSDTTNSDLYYWGTFIFRRTPPDVIRFRYIIDGPAPKSEPNWEHWSLARRRWPFAIAAILARTQSRMGSLRIFRERLAERRKWIELSVRMFLSDRIWYYSYHRAFSPAAYAEWANLIQTVDPRIAKIYEATSQYWTDRAIFHLNGNICDTCRRIITLVRFQCITCIREDMSNQVDFCEDCYDKPPVSKFSLNNDFAHKLSHSLIRSTRFIHKYELAYIIPTEVSRSQKLKKRFQGVEIDLCDSAKPIHERETNMLKFGEDHGGPSSKALNEPPPKCECCDEAISLPCYICIRCTLFFICLDCQRNHIPVKKDSEAYRTHVNTHPLLRIHDSKEVRTIKSEYDQLERQLEDMEVRINERFSDGLAILGKKLAKQLKQRTAKAVTVVATDQADVAEEANTEAHDETASEYGSAVESLDDEHAAVTAQGDLRSAEERISSLESKLAVGLTALESKLDNIGKPEERIPALENRVEDRLTALEDKVGVLISLLQQFVQPAAKSD